MLTRGAQWIGFHPDSHLRFRRRFYLDIWWIILLFVSPIVSLPFDHVPQSFPLEYGLYAFIVVFTLSFYLWHFPFRPYTTLCVFVSRYLTSSRKEHFNLLRSVYPPLLFLKSPVYFTTQVPTVLKKTNLRFFWRISRELIHCSHLVFCVYRRRSIVSCEWIYAVLHVRYCIPRSFTAVITAITKIEFLHYSMFLQSKLQFIFLFLVHNLLSSLFIIIITTIYLSSSLPLSPFVNGGHHFHYCPHRRRHAIEA